MDDQLIRELYQQLRPMTAPRPQRGMHADACVVFLYLLACLAGRSVRWVLRRDHLPLWLRKLPLPSSSCMSRRLRTESVQTMVDALNQHYRGRLVHTDEKVLDGKPLTVSSVTKDPDARRGKVQDGWAKGYKLHALVDAGGAIDAITITSLEAGESTVAQQMLQSLSLPDTLVRADANYDSNALYAVVAQTGARLLAPRCKPGTGLGHSTTQHPDRLLAIATLEQSPDAKKAASRHRMRVEQIFAHLTNLPFGLSPLPNFVRRLSRVIRWVQAKILLYHAHLATTYKQSAAA